MTSMLFDHFLVNSEVSLKKLPVSTKTVSYSKYKSIDKYVFIADLKTTCLVLDPPTDITSVEESFTYIMDTFDPLSVSEIKQLLKRFSNVLCEADPMPTWFFKECQDIVIGPIAKTVKSVSTINESCIGKTSNKKRLFAL